MRLWDKESITLAVKVKVPAWLVVPEIAPVEFSVNPLGSNPELKDQLYGRVPPLAVIVAE